MEFTLLLSLWDDFKVSLSVDGKFKNSFKEFFNGLEIFVLNVWVWLPKTNVKIHYYVLKPRKQVSCLNKICLILSNS